MAMHLGRLRAGIPGLVVGGLAFVLPSAVLVTALCWAYVRWGALPAGTAMLESIRPAVLVVILDALRGLVWGALRGPHTVAAAVAGGLVALGGASDVVLGLPALD